MSSSDITINDFDDEKLISDIGERLRIFRELVGAAPSQLARKLNKKTSQIKAIENGKKHTDCADLKYLEKKYGLNSNWLISGKGNMFNHKGPHTPASAFNAGNRVHYKSPKLFQWKDFFELIAVPSIFEELFHKLETAKQIFSNEIKLFQYQRLKPRSHEGREETQRREENKKKMGKGMDSKGSVMVKVFIVIILLVILLFFYAQKTGLFAQNKKRQPVR